MTTVAEVVIVCLPEAGHLLPTFRLARELRDRGHRVKYLVPPDFVGRVQQQGFETGSWFDELHLIGYREADEVKGVLGRRQSITVRHQAMINDLLHDQGPAADLLAHPPSLLIVDVAMPHLAIWAAKRGLPLAVLSTSLPQTRDEVVPPVRSGRVAATSRFARQRIALDWWKFLAKRRAFARVADVLGCAPPYELVRRMAADIGLGADEVASETAFLPQVLNVPELVLCPEAFDFPRPVDPNRHYVESADSHRWEGAPSIELPADKQVLYCSLGTQRYRTDVAPRFLRTVIETMRNSPNRHLVVAVGDYLNPEDLVDLPSNVQVARRAPQLEILARADLMITHGGLGSVKESIMNGVPMLVVPLAVDQPGNGARVEYYGLGRVADIDDTSVDHLRSQIDEVVSQPTYRRATHTMREQFLRVEMANRGADLVERLALSGAAAHRMAAAS